VGSRCTHFKPLIADDIGHQDPGLNYKLNYFILLNIVVNLQTNVSKKPEPGCIVYRVPGLGVSLGEGWGQSPLHSKMIIL